MGDVFRAFPEVLAALNLRPRHLVHVGAHEGQEVLHYQRAGIEHITLVEPQRTLADRLRARFPTARVEQVACADRPGAAVLHRMRHSALSTLAQPRRVDDVVGTEVVPTVRLRDLAPYADAAVIDVQGLELAVLRGADLTVASPLRLVIVETCTVGDSTMAAPHGPVTAYMARCGWVERDRWARDYQDTHRWARGSTAPVEGQIRDLIFTRDVT